MRTYSAYGNVSGNCGHNHRTMRAAYWCYIQDQKKQGSDRTQLRVWERSPANWLTTVDPTPTEERIWAYAYEAFGLPR